MDSEKARNRLFQLLNGVLDRAEKKAKHRNTVNGDKLAWNRIIIQAVNSYGRLLETAEIERIEADIEAIKDKIGLKEE